LVRGTAGDLQPKCRIDVAAELEAPVPGLHSGADTGIPVADVEKNMREALKPAASPSELVVYPDAPHGFQADYRPSYQPDAAMDGWKRLLAWFTRNGV